MSSLERDVQLGIEAFRTAVSSILKRAAGAVKKGPSGYESPTLNFLAISGGGDWGAFGTGFLVGWGQTSDPAWRRPDFDVVTGVSTGAWLSPMAFLGTDKSCLRVDDLYRNPKPDWMRRRGLFFFSPWNASLMTVPGLENELKTAVNAEFVRDIAAASRAGKVLAISATNLSLGRQRFWNVGAEAEAAELSGDSDRISRIILASSAIPAAFPPVEIDGILYGDGAVTANLLLRLDPSNPDSFLSRWRHEYPDYPLPRIRYWIILNNQLIGPEKPVPKRWPSVLGQSLATSMRHATIAEIRWLTAQVDHVNAALNTNIEVRVASIPEEWRPPVAGLFRRETMESLSDLGRRAGADPASWTQWNSPRSGALQQSAPHISLGSPGAANRS